jgi:uncharacterized protein with HEPN domain
MADRGPLLRLHDIVEFADRVATYIAGLDYRQFVAQSLTRDAVERNIEKISEASRHIPERMKSDYMHVPWRQIADIGNFLRHGYDRIDDETMWNIARLELPALKIVAEEMIRALETEDGNG